MKLENQCLVPADRETTWNLMLDIPRVARCVPGLQELVADGERDNRFVGTLQAQAGPMRVNLSGSVQILEQDAEEGVAQLLLEASDRRIGGSVRVNMVLRITPKSYDQTELVIVTDTAFMGSLGTLGQPIIRRKAAATMEEFARNLAGLVGMVGGG